MDPHRALALVFRDRGDRVIELPGKVEDVQPYYAAADTFVLPSVAEASGSVSIIEALRAGLAVIASDCDGIPEDLEDGADALLVAPGDPAALAAALTALLTDPSRRATFARHAREVYEQNFSAEQFATALMGVYTELSAALRPCRR